MRSLFRTLVLVQIFFVSAVGAVNPIIVVSIDGLRPDGIKKANPPTLLSLIENGTSFPNARTVRPSTTLPAHTSMVTGLDPSQHGIWWDSYNALYGPVRHVTALEIANKAGYHVVMIVAKDKLIHLNRPGSVDYFKKTDKEGEEVAEEFVNYVAAHGVPDVSFLHLPDPDARGHLNLWMSKAYLGGVLEADAALKTILDAAKARSEGKPITVIVTADHGGNGFNHITDVDANNSIPFIAYGENIAAGLQRNEVVRPYDVAATILAHLQLPVPATFLGVPAPIRIDKLSTQALDQDPHRPVTIW